MIVGAIAMFLASGGSAPTNFGGTVSYVEVSPDDATAYINFLNNGDITVSGSIGTEVTDTITGDDWFLPNTTSIGSSYWIRATLSSGSTPSTGTMNTWTSLSSTQSWSNTFTVNTAGSRTSTLLIEISSSSGGTPVVASGTVILTASVEL